MKDLGFSSGLIVALLLCGGCVMKSKYEMALSETEAAKTELERTRVQKTAMEQQVKGLKDLNAKLSGDAELMSSELQRIKEAREKERGGIEGRVRELEQKVKDVVGQNKSLRQENEDLRHHAEALKTTVARYQKELKDRPRSAVSTPGPASPRPPALPGVPTDAPARPQSAAAIKAPEPVSEAPAVTKPPAGLTPVNINTATASDFIVFLGMPKDVADKIVSNRPYKLKGELVARNILPKTTFDLIKDRITTSQ